MATVGPARETVRLFIAVELSDEMRAGLGHTLEAFRRVGQQDVRWVQPSNIHITLKFLGEVPANRLSEIVQVTREACQGIPSFALELAAPGAFPNLRQPRVLWVGLRGQLDVLAALQKRVEESCTAIGFPKEDRLFSPHLTLGRVREGVAGPQRKRLGDLLAAAPVEKASQTVESVSVMRSTLMPSGAVYSRLAAIPLGETDAVQRGM